MAETETNQSIEARYGSLAKQAAEAFAQYEQMPAFQRSFLREHPVSLRAQRDTLAQQIAIGAHRQTLSVDENSIAGWWTMQFLAPQEDQGALGNIVQEKLNQAKLKNTRAPGTKAATEVISHITKVPYIGTTDSREMYVYERVAEFSETIKGIPDGSNAVAELVMGNRADFVRPLDGHPSSVDTSIAAIGLPTVDLGMKMLQIKQAFQTVAAQ